MTITLDSTDATTGVDYVLYSPTGGTPDTTYMAPFDLWSEGTNILKYYGVDVRGNTRDPPHRVRRDRRHRSCDHRATLGRLRRPRPRSPSLRPMRSPASPRPTGVSTAAPGRRARHSIVSDAGEHTLEYYSTDVAGNAETTQDVDFFVKDRFEETESLLLFKGAWADAYQPGALRWRLQVRLDRPDALRISPSTARSSTGSATKAPNYGIAKLSLDGGDPVSTSICTRPTYQYKSAGLEHRRARSGTPRDRDRVDRYEERRIRSGSTSASTPSMWPDVLLEADIYDPVTTSDIDEAWQNGPVDVTLRPPTTSCRCRRRPTTASTAGPTPPTPPRSRSAARARPPSSTGRSTWPATSSPPRARWLRIDDTDPVTISDIDEAWQNGPVTVTLTADDGVLSGVEETYYTRRRRGRTTTYTAPFDVSRSTARTPSSTGRSTWRATSRTPPPRTCASTTPTR